MRKTILLLINGLGIEKKDSYEVYSAALMPNMDYMTKNYLFSSLITEVGDYNNGYKSFSMDKEDKRKEDEIDKLIFDKKLDAHPSIKELCTIGNENKLHIFYILNDGSKLNQIKELIKITNPNKDKKVFIHLILTSTGINDYKNIVKVVSKLAFETGGYAKIGFVVGSEKINSDDVLRTIYKEYGEHWHESTRKFEVLEKDMVNPKESGVFYINNGFALSENDYLLFANFTNINIDKFYSEITKIPLKTYSLYPLKDEIPSCFQKETNDVTSISDIITKYNIKLLVVTDNSRIN